jgi:hypothetical protein
MKLTKTSTFPYVCSLTNLLLMKRNIILFAMLVGIVACSKSKLIAPTQADVDAAKMYYPDMTLAQLELGRATYQSNCNLCHELFKPSQFSEDKWVEVVPGMVEAVNNKYGSTEIDNKEQEALLRYVLTMRSK